MADELTLTHVCMQFKGVKAVDDFNAHFEKGKIYGLIGTNGAGKSTVINMISGSYKPTSGEVRFGDNLINKMPGYKIAEIGIARTFQNLRLFKNMTVLENVMVAEQLRNKYNFFQMITGAPHFRKTEKQMKESAYEALEIMGIQKYANMISGNLAYGYQRRLEIARCLATDPKFLLLDEPAAGMNPNESLQLVDEIRRIHNERDITILLIEHDMKVIMSLCEYIYAMASGKTIAQGTPKEIQNNETVIKAYLGGGD